MKKILLIPSWFPNETNPLLGSFFQEQALFLYNKGFDIRILYIQEEKTNLINSIYRRISNTHLTFNDTKQQPVYLSGSVFVKQKAKQKAIIKKLYYAYLKGYKKITSDNWIPDIIHALSTENAGIIAHKLSDKLEIPFYITEHNPLIFSQRKRLDRKAFEKATKTAVVSNHLLRHILIQTFKAEPTVIWNLINENNFSIEKKSESSVFRILTISYPHVLKDMDTFFKSIDYLFTLCQDKIEVIVIGSDNFNNSKEASTENIKAIARQYKVESRCTFIPFVERENMAAILSTINVFVSTSISETFGISLREAMMCGVPVVSTKNGGADDIITTENGVLVNLKDYKSIAENIVKIKNDELSFNPEKIRESVIIQSGTQAFHTNMQRFYES